MSGRRVVVTGMGVMTSFGPGLEAALDALAAGRTAIGRRARPEVSGFDGQDVAEIVGWDPRPSFRAPKALKLADRPAQYAVASARMALEQSGYPADARLLDDLGVAIGASGSDPQTRDLVRALARDGNEWSVSDTCAFGERILGGLNPLWLLVSLPNMISAHVAIQMEAHGPNTTIMSDWTAGHTAIGEAALWIAMGEADAVLAGGADCAIQPFAFAAFEQEQLLPRDGSGGLVPAEGAAVFLLEAEETAVARGTAIYAEFRGCALCPPCAGSMSGSLQDAFAAVLSAAGWSADDVTVCGVTRPTTDRHNRAALDAVRVVFDGRLVPIDFADTLGFALAAAPPTELALLLMTSPGARVVSGCVGSSGESAALAFETPARMPGSGYTA
jgi:3-oxoacyl-[acyl-carrier-protein] synthase II